MWKNKEMYLICYGNTDSSSTEDHAIFAKTEHKEVAIEHVLDILLDFVEDEDEKEKLLEITDIDVLNSRSKDDLDPIVITENPSPELLEWLDKYFGVTDLDDD